MLFPVIIFTIVSLTYILIRSTLKKYNYWKKRNVLGPQPVLFIGNFGRIMRLKETISMFCKKLYNQYSNEKVVGIYQGHTPMLIIRDPELIRDVLIKDFIYFNDRGTKISSDTLSNNLFNAELETWRKLRHSFTPMFSSGKLKSMSPLIHACVQEFQTYVDELVDKNVEHEIRALMAKYTLEVIGSCAFGLRLGALSEKENLFREIGDNLFKPRMKSTIFRGLEMIIPGIVEFLNIKLVSTRIRTFFQDLITKVVKERNDTPTGRKDFMDLLIELKKRENAKNLIDESSESLNITNDVMAAQALVFYAAGFETSSAAMSFLLYELALNKEYQDAIYKEIEITVNKHGGISYEAVCEMTSLDMAFDEILRKYPPGGVLIRRCVMDYTFSTMNLKITKGVKILIPVYAIHHDPTYYENPEKFQPERFSIENKQNIRSCTYLPFGDGPRNCIALRFAKIESMMGLAGFLQKYKVEPSSKTQIPLAAFDATSVTTKSRDGIWLNITRR